MISAWGRERLIPISVARDFASKLRLVPKRSPREPLSVIDLGAAGRKFSAPLSSPGQEKQQTLGLTG